MGFFDRFRGKPPDAKPTSTRPRTSASPDLGRAKDRSRPSLPDAHARAAEPTSPASAACKEILGRVGELDAVPGLAAQLLQKLGDPKMSTNEVAAEISNDQGLLAMVLRTANSAFYRASGQVRDITESLVVLGVDTVRQLVLGRLSKSMLRRNDELQKTLWRHALATGLAAQACARQVRGVTVAHAFTGGLLHDIGKAVLHEAAPAEYEAVWQLLAANPRPSDEVERERFGTDHAEVGGELLRQWQLPKGYENVARGHHGGRPLAGLTDKDHRLLAIVTLGDAVALAMGHGPRVPAEVAALASHPMMQVLRGTPNLLAVMEEHVKRELAEVERIFT